MRPVLLAAGFAVAASLKAPTTHAWAPQDLTKDRAGFAPIPDNDYVKQYERNRALSVSYTHLTLPTILLV